MVGRIGPKLAGNDALDACLDGCVNNALVEGNVIWRQQKHDRILPLQGGQELVFRVGAVHSVDFDVGWECRG